MIENNKTNLPAGYRLTAVRTTYLEMKAKPMSAPPAVPAGCEVKKWEKPGTAEYRRLFAAVGGEWGWCGRLLLPEDGLRKILAIETNEIHLLYSRCRVAGFAELDRGHEPQVEISYFGLLPEFIGKGLGRFLLDWAVRRAWEGGTERVWLHTCEYDHPKAMASYLKAGFRVVEEKTEAQPYAEEFLLRTPPVGH
jgi:GNAT superfamily N-acetyltransferase